MRKDLLGIKDLPQEEIMHLITQAAKHKPKVKDKALRDNTMGKISLTTMFYENSTRTKMSFLLAAEYLGAYADDLNISTSSVSKGESLVDTGLMMDAMGTNIIVMRHGMSGAVHLLAKNVRASVINGGDGSNEHPTQALLDMFTIWEKKGGFNGLNVTIVGDIANSRVARSNVFGLTKMGANVTLAGPATLLSNNMKALGASVVTTNVAEAIKNADVVMGLRIQLERQKAVQFPSLREYTRFFGVNNEMLALARKDALVMHPGPFNRGVELSSDVIDGGQSAIYEQVENGVAMRMAVIEYLVSGQGAVTYEPLQAARRDNILAMAK